MTLAYAAEVVCEFETRPRVDGMAMICGRTFSSMSTQVGEIRPLAWREGWETVLGADFCPDHRPGSPVAADTLSQSLALLDRLPEVLVAFRHQYGYTQADVAGGVHVAQNTIQRFERGKAIGSDNLARLLAWMSEVQTVPLSEAG